MKDAAHVDLKERVECL